MNVGDIFLDENNNRLYVKTDLPHWVIFGDFYHSIWEILFDDVAMDHWANVVYPNPNNEEF